MGTLKKHRRGGDRAAQRRRYRQRENGRKAIERYRLKVDYGITPEQRDVLAQAQNGKCAICQQAIKLCIDHCHTTGRVRGLLCSNCNRGLGFFKDSPLLLHKAVEYLSH